MSAQVPQVSYAVPDIGRFRLADRDVVLVSGAEANQQFFRAPDSTLDQAAAYPFMTPLEEDSA